MIIKKFNEAEQEDRTTEERYSFPKREHLSSYVKQ
jgi:hypothetical protein